MKFLLKILIALMILLPIAAFVHGQGEAKAQSTNEYFRNLTNKGNATYYDAFRIIIILKDGKDSPDITFDGLKNKLIESKIIPSGWSKVQEKNFINRADVAYMLVKTLSIKGGVTLRVFGLTPRYALRECIMRNLIPNGYPNQLISGGELISVLMHAEKYQDKENGRND